MRHTIDAAGNRAARSDMHAADARPSCQRSKPVAHHRDYPFAVDSSPKAIKAQAYNYLNAIHYLAPADTSGVNICPKASAGCKALCLGWFSGQAGIGDDNGTRRSRLDKTQRFMRDRKAYLADIVRQIERQQRRAAKREFKLCVRLNGSSDIAWEGIRLDNGQSLLERFPDIAFVDYTKIASRFDRKLSPNYHLTFSRSETNEQECLDLLARGINVAVVFAGDKPATWHGFECIDGDEHDLRHLDKKGGYVIALSPKGSKAKHDTSGFVVR
jgi:hypothetical protein